MVPRRQAFLLKLGGGWKLEGLVWGVVVVVVDGGSWWLKDRAWWL